MTFNQYQEGVRKTWNVQIPREQQLLNASLGLGEVGEFQNLVKKMLFHGEVVKDDEFLDELGDIQYYITVIGELLGFTLEEIAAANNKKLRKRYPEGFKKGGGKR
jgi:NTP pyrophosphatase (non-canonical NTP hydrolase)